MNRIISTVVLNWLKLKKIFRFTPHDTTNAEGKSHERYRRILLTGGSTAIVKVFSAVINLITVPLTVNYLGAERYGLWMAISSVLALMSFADLGLGNGLLNAVSKANGRNNIEEAQTAVSSTFFILLGISLILLLLFIAVFPFISWKSVFNVKSALAIKESGPTMMALVVILLINMPLGIVERIQSGYQEGYRFQLWLILGSILSLAGLLICIFFKGGLTWLVIAYSGGQLIATLLNGVYLLSFRRRYLKPKFNYFKWDTGKLLIKSGFTFLLLGLFTLFANASDDIIIAHTLSPSSVAGYEIVKKLFFFSMFTQYIIQPLWPAFSEALISGDLNWARKTMQKALKLSIVSGAIITLPFLLFGKQIVTIWVGKEFIPSWSLLFGFYFYVILNNYIGVMSTLLNSSKLVRRLIVPMALTAIVCIALKFILSLSIGISGIIWASVIGWSIFFAIPSYSLSKSIFR
ncbi:MAG TPA: oligosaccharide flippase family protein [Hanamia sp.]